VFELGSMAEGVDRGGSVQSAVVRSGSYAYPANPVNSNQFIGFYSQVSGGVMRQIFRSSRFYLRVGQLPAAGSVSIVKLGGATTFNPEVDLNSDGTLRLADSLYPVIARSTKSLSADGLWHRIELDIGYLCRRNLMGEGQHDVLSACRQYFVRRWRIANFRERHDPYFDNILVDGDSFSDGVPGRRPGFVAEAHD
jgi:hypothetical protein